MEIYETAPISDEAVRIVGYRGGEEASIPETLHGLAVREIGREAFSGHTELRSLLLPEGIETIRAGAFAGCVGLESVTIPASVSRIEEGAFVR